MRVLVTGGSGFLGRNFLLASDPTWSIDAVYHSAADFPAFVAGRGLQHVRAHRCDLSRAPDVRALAGALPERFDAILYLAANADPARSAVDPAADLAAGPVALVHVLSTFRCERLVYFSSGAVYDGLRGEVSPDTPVAPRLPYAISKLACERYVRWFRHEGRVGSFVILRFFGAYGPLEPSRKIYTRLVQWAASGAREPFQVRGDGRNRIDAMYVGDAVRGIEKVLRSGASDHVVDFASAAALTIDELVERAGRILGIGRPGIAHVGSVPEYIEFFVSNQKMKQLFDFSPHVPLEEGLLCLRDHLAALESYR